MDSPIKEKTNANFPVSCSQLITLVTSAANRISSLSGPSIRRKRAEKAKTGKAT